MPPEKFAEAGGDKVSQGRIARNGEVASGLEAMPLDVLYEVMRDLGSTDLLSLSRTSKAFRQFLMCRESAEMLWKEARIKSQEGVPPCPPHLSEPAYANLLFGTHCGNCTHRVEDSVAPVFCCSMRYCHRCKQTLFLRDAAAEVGTPGWEDGTFIKCCPLHWLGGHRLGFDLGRHRRDIDYYRLNIKPFAEADREKYLRLVGERAKWHTSVREHGHVLEQWWQRREAARAKERQRAEVEYLETLDQVLTFLSDPDNYDSDPDNHE